MHVLVQTGSFMTATAYSMAASSTQAAVARAQEPPRGMQWSLLLVGAGCVMMFVGIVLAATGVPGKLAYDINGEGARIKNSSSNPMQISAAIDANIKVIAEGSGFEKNQLNWYFNGVSRSEDQIPVLAQAAQDMSTSVTAIDEDLSDVYRSTVAMRVDMEEMAASSAASARTMERVNSDVGELGAAMSDLQKATSGLVASMARIEQRAGSIATNGTGTAVRITRRMNSVLPERVPTPQTSLEPTPQWTRGAL
jgi:hypothetical protein